jgi:hypothetical protein
MSELAREAVEAACLAYFGKDFWMGMTEDARNWERDAFEHRIAPHLRPAEGTQRRVRHKKRRSTYRVIGEGRHQDIDPRLDDSPIIIYQSESDGKLYTRFQCNFNDGRFEELPPADLRAAPSQSDEEWATEALFGAELGVHVGNKERDLYAISFATLLRALAAVRAEEQDACAKVADQYEGSSHNTTNTVRAVAAAIRARKP